MLEKWLHLRREFPFQFYVWLTPLNIFYLQHLICIYICLCNDKITVILLCVVLGAKVENILINETDERLNHVCGF